MVRNSIKNTIRDLAIDIAAEDQGLDAFEKKNWVPLEEFERARDAAEAGILPLMRSPTVSSVTREQKELMFQYLVLCFNTMRPPTRTETVELCVLQKMPQNPHGTDKNYIVVNDTEASVVINRDKAVSYMGPDILPIENRFLVQIIQWSMKFFPRAYLFSEYDDGQAAMGFKEYGRLLGLHWQPDRKVNYRIVRSAFVTAFYKKHPGLADRERLARFMRHQKQTAEQCYFKQEGPSHFKQEENPLKRREYYKDYYGKNKDKLRKKNELYWSLHKFDINRQRVATRDRPTQS